jgi:hypothetical protein
MKAIIFYGVGRKWCDLANPIEPEVVAHCAFDNHARKWIKVKSFANAAERRAAA